MPAPRTRRKKLAVIAVAVVLALGSSGLSCKTSPEKQVPKAQEVFQWAPWSSLPVQRLDGATATGPALAAFAGNLYAIWKGAQPESGITWARYDGARWSVPQRIGAVATSA